MKAITVILCLGILVLVTACSYNPKTADTYKILLGKKCTEDSTKFSYVWFHTVYGEKQVRKEWCK